MITDKGSKENTIFELQEELLRIRRDFGLREGDWKREKIILQQKIQIVNMELADFRYREANLKKVNQALTMAQHNFYKQEDSGLREVLASLSKTTSHSSIARETLSGTRQEEVEERVRLSMQQEWKRQQDSIREEFGYQLEIELREQEKKLNKKSQLDLARMEADLKQKYQGQIESHLGEIRRWKDEVHRLRQESQERSRRSINTSQSSRFINFINSSKQVLDRRDTDTNASNVVSEMLCEVCDNVFSTNDFFEHIQDCQREEQQNYQQLLSRKKEIQHQLQYLQLSEKPKQSKQVIMIIKEGNTKKRRQKEKSFVNSHYPGSPSRGNSMFGDDLMSLKSSARGGRY